MAEKSKFQVPEEVQVYYKVLTELYVFPKGNLIFSTLAILLISYHFYFTIIAWIRLSRVWREELFRLRRVLSSCWITLIFSLYVTLLNNTTLLYIYFITCISNGLMRRIFFMFKTLDNWTFDPFKFNELTGGHTLRYLGHELFIRYDLMAKFKVSDEIYN